jgi:hypothetical protein
LGRPATHGLHSRQRVEAGALVVKRRTLRRLGLTAPQLDPLGRSFLDNYARAQSKVELVDRWMAVNGGPLDENGKPLPCADWYLRCLEAARRALAKLEQHVDARSQPSAVIEMQTYARERERSRSPA